MKREIKQTTYIQSIILLLVLLTMLTVWPLNQWKTKTVSEMGTAGYRVTDEVTDGVSVKQEFLPEQARVDTISVQIEMEQKTEDAVLLHLYSPENVMLLETTGKWEERETGSYVTFPVYMTLQQGATYTYTLDYLGVPFAGCFDEKDSEVQAGNQRLFYQEQELVNCALNSSYQYEVPFQRTEKIITWVVLLVVALLAVIVTGVVGKAKKNNVLIAFHLRNYLSPLIVFATIVAMLKVWPGYTFSSNPIDLLVYECGILFAGITLFYGSRQLGKESWNWTGKKILAKIPNGLQIIFFGGAIVACCDFVNAITNYEQALATRMMLTFFGLAIISMFEKKELFRIYNYLYLAITVVGGYFYVRGMEGETYEVGIRTVFVVVVWGIVVLNTVFQLFKRKLSRLSIIPALMVAGFLTLTIVYRHVYTWPIVAAFAFGLFYLRRIPFEKMNCFLQNAGNGFLFSFVVMTYKALRYRPFHNFRYVRYSGMFHTVTYTTVFYALVFTVVLCKLLIAYKKSSKLKDTWKELTMLGIVCGYQFLALSRTGIVASIAAFFVAITLFAIFEHRNNWKTMLYKIVLPVLAIIWFIPIVFTTTRMVPAITNEPYIFEGEWFSESIQPGEMINSRRYITVEKFLGLSKERILGKEADSASLTALPSQELLASTQDPTVTQNATAQNTEPPKTTNYDVTKDYTNGRSAILKAYLQNLNQTGHETISLTLENGEFIVHAHNSFVQVAYDSGIWSGILFLLICIVFGIRAIRYYICFYKKQPYAMLPLLIFITFGVSGMVEYVFRPTIPLGFAFLLMFAPLLPKMPKLELNSDVALIKCEEQQETTELES